MSYSTDLRSRVLELVDKDKSPKEIALLFKISRATIFWKNQPEAYVNGKPDPKTARCIERKKLSDLMLKKLA